MPSVPLLEVGQSVLVAPTPDDAPWRMNVDVVQEGHITLATVDDEKLPAEWKQRGAISAAADAQWLPTASSTTPRPS